MSYKIIRFFYEDDVPNRTIETGLTLDEAQEHCQDEETSASTCTERVGLKRTEQFGKWFDGYEEEN